VREAAWGGGLFLTAERPGVSGDGVAAQLAPTIRPHRSNANQHLVITHGLFAAPLTRSPNHGFRVGSPMRRSL
jgi:hypothetical protein